MTYVGAPLSRSATHAFAAHYREAAVPKIKHELDVLAVLIDAGSIAFDEAYDEAITLADKLGAGYLPHSDLYEWILVQLSEAVSIAKERGDAARAVLKRAELADPVAYYEKLAAGCAKPESARWAFAAISKEYRTHLVKCRASR
jgi:hypothetical protein